MSSRTNHLSAPKFINQQLVFEELMERLQYEKILAIDTEANSLFAYREQVCLIQISTNTTDYIIDPLSLDDLAPLGQIFKNPEVEKVFHASEYDILIMNDDFNFEFSNLFDTMLAAQILGREKLGLDTLMEEIVGVQVNKKYQRANWGKRPLSNDMLQYAQMDTHYLIKIRQTLAKELKESGFTLIATEDFKRACQVHRQPKEENIASFWRINGSRKLTPQKAAVLAKLCEYRDDVARKRNLPVFKVLSAKTLLHLAEESPTSKNQLLRLDIPGGKAIQRHTEGLVGVIQDGLASKPEVPPRRKRLDDSYLSREKALRDWRKIKARKMNVNSAVVLPREILYSLISSNPKNRSELALVLKEVPWRLERFGDDILSILLNIR
ncbi:MAG: HRDC domain-containing protein [Anaerolineales bacterium]|nr:HRDC domain-containing protein [Anaerolineales bacterium]